jgi:phospholipid/cholesterol/gamma-HCH transport system substrate-binding protein
VLRSRIAALAAVAALSILALTLLVRGPAYEVGLTVSNASQLVKGDQVKVGGVPVGKVSKIGLADDGRAHLVLSLRDDELTPLHSGTKALIRSVSLAGIANRYVAILPGPNNAREIPDGGEIPADDATPEVDLDAVLNTLGPAAQRDLHDLVAAGSGMITPETERQANEGIEALNPALSQSAATARQIVRDQPAFERFILESANVVSAVASRRDDLDQVVGNTAGALDALAARSHELDRTLVKLPDTLRSANTTLVNVRATLADLRPALRDARPAAPLLSALLERLSPVARRAIPVVARTQRAVDRPGSDADLLGVVGGFAPLAKEALPAFESLRATLSDALPIVREARPYTPDVMGGLVNGFGGTTGGYYDANGHYARIAFEGGPYSLANGGSVVPMPPSHDGLSGYRKGLTSRCPGAAAQPARDKSNPFKTADTPCRPEDSPR